MKRADHSTQLKGTPKEDVPPPPTAQTGKNPKDARDDDAQLKENQQDLHVGEDHKTPEMEQGNRGTFP